MALGRGAPGSESYVDVGMRVETGWVCSVAAVEQASLPNARPQRLLAGVTLTCVAALCAWTIIGNLYSASDDDGSAAAVERPRGAFAERFDSVATRGDQLASSISVRFAAIRPSSPAISNAFASLFDHRFSLGYRPGGFIRNAALEPQPETTQSASAQDPAAPHSDRVADATPLPLPRPRLLDRLAALRGAHAERIAAATPAQDASQDSSQQHEPTIFEKLFGKPKPFALAYAAPDDANLGRPVNIVARYDSSTAVYDISAKTVYLPDGRRLEAHSGLGQYLDDPHHVDLRMRGATPPTIYDLSVREGLFHGVRALRLTPEDESKVYGRAGLLAHTFMLGPNGDSNGCVSFRNYEAFLQAYLDHKVTKLAVVSSLD